MKLNWFTRKWIFYFPSSLMGWTILAAAIIYVIYLFIDSRSHSASDTLINWVFNYLIVGVVYTGIGFLTEKRLS